jgi:hypothetical protein
MLKMHHIHLRWSALVRPNKHIIPYKQNHDKLNAMVMENLAKQLEKVHSKKKLISKT